MRTYIVKRLLLMIPTLIGMTFLTYAIVRLAPGDPVEAMIRNQSGNIDPKAMRASADRIRERLGLNDINFWGPDVQSHLETLKSDDPAARAKAVEALKAVTGLDINTTREVWEMWWNGGKLILSKVEPLLESLKGPDEAKRKEAAAQLKAVTAEMQAAMRTMSDKPIALSATPEEWTAWVEHRNKLFSETEPLIWQLRSPDEDDRTKAAAELKRVTGLDFTDNVGAWNAWWAANKFVFTRDHLIDPAEKVANVLYGYLRWMTHVLTGDLGESIVFRMPKTSPIVGYLSGLRNFLWGMDVDQVNADLAALKSDDAKARDKAAQDLVQIAGQAHGTDATAWQTWWDGFRLGVDVERVNKDLAALTSDDTAKQAEAAADLKRLSGKDHGTDAKAWQAWWDDRRTAGWWQGLDEMKANGSKNPLWIIIDRIPVTFTLNVIAEFIIFIVAVPIGLAAARYQGQWFDVGSSYVMLALYSIPAVLAGSLLLSFLARGGLGLWWFPVGGLHEQGYEKLGTWAAFVDLLHHAALPVICMVYGGFAYLAKFARASLLENLRADYVRTARAKGLSERRVVYYHAFRNSLLPMITIMVLILPVGDILYAWADPRVRYE